MENYDENLSDNIFFNHFKSEYKLLFEEVVSSSCIICIPKSDVVKEVTIDKILDHVLVPDHVDDNQYSPNFLTKTGLEILIKNDRIIPKEKSLETKYVNILFEEMFYDKNLGKYKVLCIDNLISNLFVEEEESNIVSCDVQRNILENVDVSNLRSIHDFIKFISSITKNTQSTDIIDNFITDFLSFHTSAMKEYNNMQLEKDVCELYEKVIIYFGNTLDILSTNNSINFNICIESYLMHYLYKVLFQRSCSDMGTKDGRLNRILHKLEDFDVSEFDIKITNFNNLLSARYELAAINNFKSPFGKLQCVKRAIDYLEKGNSLNSDELLSLLVFCIIKCQLKNWFANISFIETYHFSLKKYQKYDFILSTFKAALVYLLSEQLCSYSNAVSNDTNKPNYEENSREFKNLGNIHYIYKIIKKDDVINVKKFFEADTAGKISQNFAIECTNLCHPLCTCEKCLVIARESTCISNYDINFADESMMTALHYAAVYGSVSTAEYLIQSRANVECRNSLGRTPLHLTAYKGNQSILLLLLNSGCFINCLDNEGNTPLHLCCVAGHDRCLKALIFFSESIGFPLGFTIKNIKGDTPLHLASCWGYFSIIKLLINEPFVLANCLDVKNNQNQTPLDCAHNNEIATLLINAKFEDNATSRDLILVNMDQNVLDEENLIRKPCKTTDCSSVEEDTIVTTISDTSLFTKIRSAIQINDIELVCFYLGINSEITLNSDRKNAQCHPLCQCSKCIFPQTISKRTYSLLNHIGSQGLGILHTIILNTNLKLCEILLHNGADPNTITSIEKQSYLHLAVMKENIDIVKILIRFYAYVNSKDHGGRTPLHLCCIQGWKEGAVILINSGADTQSQNNMKLTPNEEAEKNGHLNFIETCLG